ncbi:hypothetical protein [Kitasatospora herbaricolor]|uniref:Uncharacterized protein n=1 Tax=Kitasatospora herbaricolor TaxID=68217 RepID=A0ABZ1W0K6_9ACTN|nr:hypothetical protein [Kitasatospora herbaricolor]
MFDLTVDEVLACARQAGDLKELQLGAFVGVVDGDVFDADHAVAAPVGATAVGQWPGVAVRDNGVLEADGAGGVGRVEQAIVEDAEPDGDPRLPEQVFLDPRVSAAGVDGRRDLVEDLLDPVSGGAVARAGSFSGSEMS